MKSKVVTFDTQLSTRNQVGNKGLNLMLMTQLGLPVPPGFIIPISEWKVWPRYKILPIEMIENGCSYLARKVGKGFGDGLRVAVRSSELYEMHGAMETVLDVDNLGSVFKAVKTVFESWNGNRAKEYRKIEGILDYSGTAVIVQQMVYGDAPGLSGTGIVYTRNVITGNLEINGEWLPNMRGPSLAGGEVTPSPLQAFEKSMPHIYLELLKYAYTLDNYFNYGQDIEFTVETGKLYILQTRELKICSNKR